MMPTTSNYTSVKWSLPCRQIEFSEILLATENFDESLVIGSGGFGKVYKGNIKNGSSLVLTAIKRLDPMSNQGSDEFWAEVDMLSTLRHCHLVSLIGYCNYEKEFILVYEYMPNGTLEDHLHKLHTSLSWLQRLQICIGAGRGLDYLHTGTGIEFGVVHRDVKTSNILLHEKWAAKISDFGLSKISPANQPSTYVNTLIKGTFGYIDPNYFATGRLTRKSDVYAFGVVLFEVLCRKRAVDRSLEWGLATWAQDSIKSGELKRIIDSDIRGQISPKCLKEFVRIAQRCLDNHPKHRPTMGEVVFGLESVLTLQEKIDISMQNAGKTILAKMVDMLPFSTNGDPGSSLHVSKKKENDNKLLALFRSKKKEEAIQLPLFSFATIATATACFSTANLLGHGAFGQVYKGVLEEGLAIAVKRLSDTSTQGSDEFNNEIVFLSKLRHKNLVKLLGYCIKGKEKLLIYEYMPNKSLDAFIFDENQRMLVDWTKWFHIIKGIAQGLLYLYHGSPIRIIHRDLKAANILLDLDMNPKISDFGLARSLEENETETNTQRVVGTYGYMAPEYAMHGLLSIKSDVFSFGILMLEIVSGKKNSRSYELNDNELIGYAWSLYRKGKSEELIDASFAESCHLQEVLRSIKVGLLCVQEKAADRPDMIFVVQMLDGEDVFLPEPKQPAYFIERNDLTDGFSSSDTIASSINGLTITELDGR